MEVKLKIEQFLNVNKDEKKAEFDSKLIFTKYPILGIKTKSLEDFAKELLKEGADAKDIPLVFHEEIVLAGFMIAFSKESAERRIEKFKYLLPYIDNWGSCDMIVGRLKNLEGQKDFFVSLLDSDNVYTVRVGIIWLFKFAMKDDVKFVYSLLSKIDCEKWDKNSKIISSKVFPSYYVKMAIAWCYSEACIYDFDFMYNKLLNMNDKFIKLKTVQKACESYRIDAEKKEKLKSLRKKSN